MTVIHHHMTMTHHFSVLHHHVIMTHHFSVRHHVIVVHHHGRAVAGIGSVIAGRGSSVARFWCSVARFRSAITRLGRSITWLGRSVTRARFRCPMSRRQPLHEVSSHVLDSSLQRPHEVHQRLHDGVHRVVAVAVGAVAVLDLGHRRHRKVDGKKYCCQS